jgi:ABC-type uncharacterized transport system ATPase subunit
MFLSGPVTRIHGHSGRTAMSRLELDGLTRAYGPVTALDHLSFSVTSGQVTGFLGPNGAGKPRYWTETVIATRARSPDWQEIGLGQCCGPPLLSD